MIGCSVIVPTYNRLPQLKQCIAVLAALTHPAYEVIVINDGSTDGTKEYLTQLSNTRFKVVNLPQNLGVSEARNRGVAEANYPIVAFTDDDCIAEPTWLSELLKPFANEQIGFSIGATEYVAHGYCGYFPERIIQNQHGQFPGAGNIAYRKEVFAKIGGFKDEFFRVYHNEDSELAVRAVVAGFTYVSCPAAVVFHQASTWTVHSLLNSAKNSAVWPVMKKLYPNHYRYFKPPVYWNTVVMPQEYLYLLLSPILIPLLFARYLWHGKRDVKIFFTKWPLWLILKRYYIYREALRQKVFMI